MTSKERPTDADVIWFPPLNANLLTIETSWGLLAPSRRFDLKHQHMIDLLPWPSPQPKAGKPGGYETIVDYFSTDRSEIPKGMIRLLNLKALSP